MITAIIIGFITILLLWDYLTKRLINDKIRDLPGPRPLPLLGNILMYRGKSPEDIMTLIFNNRRKYGRFYRVWQLNQLAIFSCDPNDIEVILSSQKHITKNNLYDLLHSWLGTGLLMSTGKKWFTRRKIITPTFHFTILEQFVDIFNQQSDILVEKLQPLADGQTPVNIFPFICLMALDIIAETAMGTRINAQMNPNFPYVQAVFAATNIVSKRLINVWHRHDFLFRLTAPLMAKQFADSIKLMHNFTENIIMERRQNLNASSFGTTQNGAQIDEDVGQKQRFALLDVLLQSTINGEPLKNEDIREEVDTFMFEGHDTTTSGISFCLYEIARHPRVQTRLVQEIMEALSEDKTRHFNLHDLNDLKYLECTIKESLRLHPAVPVIGRHFEEDVNINGKIIPAGTNVTIGLFVMLKDAEYFPEPDQFKPERFLNENMGSVRWNPYAYVPFSGGPRNCIGQRFAMLEMKSAISKILRHFELLPLGPEVRPMMNLVLRSANGNHIGLRRRQLCERDSN